MENIPARDPEIYVLAICTVISESAIHEVRLAAKERQVRPANHQLNAIWESKVYPMYMYIKCKLHCIVIAMYDVVCLLQSIASQSSKLMINLVN